MSVRQPKNRPSRSWALALAVVAVAACHRRAPTPSLNADASVDEPHAAGDASPPQDADAASGDADADAAPTPALDATSDSPSLDRADVADTHATSDSGSADAADAPDAAVCRAQVSPGVCSPVCAASGWTPCGSTACVDVTSDPRNCGGCGSACTATGLAQAFTQWSCVHAKCVATCYQGTGDCDDQPGCESVLNTAENCGACGTKACAAANTILTCDVGRACVSPVCSPGFANCNTASVDCETAVGAAGTCFPRYLGTVVHATRSVYTVAAEGPDSSMYFGGDLVDATEDFDPTAGRDVRAAGAKGMSYLTKVNPDGSYGWTRTFDAAYFLFDGLAADGDSVVAVGSYQGAVDFDPGAAAAVLGTAAGASSFVLKLSPAGEFRWARDYQGDIGLYSVALDGGAVVFGGSVGPTVDLDLGAGTTKLDAPDGSVSFIAKLDTNGQFVWARGQHGAGCSGGVIALSASVQGPIWAVGTSQGACTFAPAGAPPAAATFAAQLSADGTLLRELTFPAASDLRSISTAVDGSIYVGGIIDSRLGPLVDVDPTAGIDRRAAAGSGFVTKLSPDGSYAWSQLWGHTWITVAAAPDGGVLASGLLGDQRLVSKLGADGTVAWTLGYFSDGDDFRLAAGPTTFVVAAPVSSGALDFDPGPGVDNGVGGGGSGHSDFFSKYAY